MFLNQHLAYSVIYAAFDLVLIERLQFNIYTFKYFILLNIPLLDCRTI